MAAGFIDFLRKTLGWLSSPAVSAAPIKRLSARGRIDTVLVATGSIDTALSASGRVDVAFVAVGRSDVAAIVNLGCEYGEDVIVDWTNETGENITAMTIAAELLAAEGDLTASAIASGTVTKTGTTTATIAFSSAGTSSRNITHWRVRRTDSGSKTVFTKGKWKIGGESASGV